MHDHTTNQDSWGNLQWDDPMEHSMPCQVESRHPTHMMNKAHINVTSSQHHALYYTHNAVIMMLICETHLVLQISVGSKTYKYLHKFQVTMISSKMKNCVWVLQGRYSYIKWLFLLLCTIVVLCFTANHSVIYYNCSRLYPKICDDVCLPISIRAPNTNKAPNMIFNCQYY